VTNMVLQVLEAAIVTNPACHALRYFISITLGRDLCEETDLVSVGEIRNPVVGLGCNVILALNESRSTAGFSLTIPGIEVLRVPASEYLEVARGEREAGRTTGKGCFDLNLEAG
jgi:hypothetical protein